MTPTDVLFIGVAVFAIALLLILLNHWIQIARASRWAKRELRSAEQLLEKLERERKEKLLRNLNRS